MLLVPTVFCKGAGFSLLFDADAACGRTEKMDLGDWY